MGAVSEEELRLALESLRGRIGRLDTVLRMSVAEQRRLNGDFTRAMRNQEGSLRRMDERLARQERRLAGYTEALAAIWLLIQIVQMLLR